MKKTIIIFILFISVITVCVAKTKYVPIIIINNSKPKQTAPQRAVLPAVLPPIEEQTATPTWLIATPTASLTTDIGGNQ